MDIPCNKYFIYFLIPFVPILIGIATIILLNKLGSKAEEDGTFEFVAALPMTRSTVYLTQSLLAVFFGLFVTFAWTNIMFIPIATMELSQTLDYVPLMKATLQAALAGVSFGVLGFALGAYTGKSSMAWAFGGGLMAIEYLANSLFMYLSHTNRSILWAISLCSKAPYNFLLSIYSPKRCNFKAF